MLWLITSIRWMIRWTSLELTASSDHLGMPMTRLLTKKEGTERPQISSSNDQKMK